MKELTGTEKVVESFNEKIANARGDIWSVERTTTEKGEVKYSERIIYLNGEKYGVFHKDKVKHILELYAISNYGLKPFTFNF